MDGKTDKTTSRHPWECSVWCVTSLQLLSAKICDFWGGLRDIWMDSRQTEQQTDPLLKMRSWRTHLIMYGAYSQSLIQNWWRDHRVPYWIRDDLTQSQQMDTYGLWTRYQDGKKFFKNIKNTAFEWFDNENLDFEKCHFEFFEMQRDDVEHGNPLRNDDCLFLFSTNLQQTWL